MDRTINDIIINLQKIEKALIHCYQADSIGQTKLAVELAMQINQGLITSGLSFSKVALELVEKNLRSGAKLTVIK